MNSADLSQKSKSILSSAIYNFLELSNQRFTIYRAVGSVNFVAADFNPPRVSTPSVLSAIGTVHLDNPLILNYICRTYGTQKTGVLLFGGLKSAATKLTEPTALLDVKRSYNSS